MAAIISFNELNNSIQTRDYRDHDQGIGASTHLSHQAVTMMLWSGFLHS